MNKTHKTLIGAFFLPLMLAFYFLLTQEYMRHVDKGLCKPKPPSNGGFSFDISGHSSGIDNLFFSEVIPCSSAEAQFVYRALGFATFICFGLATVLPCIILLRRRPVEKTKLFE